MSLRRVGTATDDHPTDAGNAASSRGLRMAVTR